MTPTQGWRPAASIEALRMRARLHATARAFLVQRQLLEVETPVLSAAGNTEPRITSFETCYSGPVAGGASRRFLRTSPEYALKRLLAAGIGDCFELGRVFRNGEAGRRHNPEFTMLEWYRVGWDHHRLMQETADLLQAALALSQQCFTVVRRSYRQLFQEELGVDTFHAPQQHLQQALDGLGIACDGLRRDDLLDLLLTHRLQPAFPSTQLLLLFDFPPSQCALARVSDRGDGAVAERFEAFLGPLEVANGYHELCDAVEQRARFEHDNQQRASAGLPTLPIDERLLQALQAGLPACAGVAVGLDRVLSALLGQATMDELLAFPFDRA